MKRNWYICIGGPLHGQFQHCSSAHLEISYGNKYSVKYSVRAIMDQNEQHRHYVLVHSSLLESDFLGYLLEHYNDVQ